MHVNILILMVYTSNYQANTFFYENMRNDFKKTSFEVKFKNALRTEKMKELYHALLRQTKI